MKVTKGLMTEVIPASITCQSCMLGCASVVRAYPFLRRHGRKAAAAMEGVLSLPRFGPLRMVRLNSFFKGSRIVIASVDGRYQVSHFVLEQLG